LATHPNFQPYGDLSEAQFQAMAQDMVMDLAEFGMSEIESGIIAYRQDPKSKGFPHPGKLRELCSIARRERAAASRPRQAPGKTRPMMWWLQDRRMWKPDWLESDIPAGEKVRDQVTGELREPNRY
jgi:hypothetical protein